MKTLIEKASRLPATSIFAVTILRFFVYSLDQYIPMFMVSAIAISLYLVIAIWLFSINVEINKALYGGRMVVGRLFFACIAFSILYSFIVQLSVFQQSGPLQLVSMLCYFYILYYSTTRILEAENKEYGVADIAWLFLAFLFLPIGIWIIKPRIDTARTIHSRAT